MPHPNGASIYALHGGALTPSSWDAVRAAAPEITFEIPDLNEMATSLHPNAGWDALAQAVADAAPSGPFVLAGTTIGGRLGLSAARLLGDRVQAIYLLTPTPPDESRAFIDMLAGLRRFAMGDISPRQIEVQVGVMLHRWGPRFGQAARELEVLLAEGSVRGRALARIASEMDEPPSRWLDRLQIPVHVRYGAFDPMCRSEFMDVWRQQECTASLEAWQGVAHHLALEAPERVAADLRALVAS